VAHPGVTWALTLGRIATRAYTRKATAVAHDASPTQTSSLARALWAQRPPHERATAQRIAGWKTPYFLALRTQTKQSKRDGVSLRIGPTAVNLRCFPASEGFVVLMQKHLPARLP
jgi:hypothetical protein